MSEVNETVTETKPEQMTDEQIKSAEQGLRHIQLTKLIGQQLGEDKLTDDQLIQVIYFFSLGYAASQVVEPHLKFKLTDLYGNKLYDMVEFLLPLLGVSKKSSDATPVAENTDTQTKE